MSGAARLTDSILGTTTGEHGGHIPGHSVSSITGSISSNCSSNVYINGLKAAFVGSITSEYDVCTNGSGSIAVGSSKVFVNGEALARVGDKINPHNGTCKINSGSSNVIIG